MFPVGTGSVKADVSIVVKGISVVVVVTTGTGVLTVGRTPEVVGITLSELLVGRAVVVDGVVAATELVAVVGLSVVPTGCLPDV